MTVADPLPAERVLATAEELADVHDLTELRRLRDIAFALKDEPARALLQSACDLADGRELIEAIRADKVAEKREQIRLEREARERRDEELKQPEAGPRELPLAPFGADARSADLGE